jgi:hypothetical protein
VSCRTAPLVAGGVRRRSLHLELSDERFQLRDRVSNDFWCCCSEGVFKGVYQVRKNRINHMPLNTRVSVGRSGPGRIGSQNRSDPIDRCRHSDHAPIAHSVLNYVWKTRCLPRNNFKRCRPVRCWPLTLSGSRPLDKSGRQQRDAHRCLKRVVARRSGVVGSVRPRRHRGFPQRVQHHPAHRVIPLSTGRVKKQKIS